MENIRLVVFDMAGTTVKDEHEVEDCFYRAAIETGLPADQARIKAMQGYPKLEVVKTLWDENIGTDHPEYDQRVQYTYRRFREILEKHYTEHTVQPTEGTLELFAWLRSEGIKIALTTGFYRKITNIILQKLGWNVGLNEQYLGNGESIIDLSLSPDETGRGRPYPDMILKAMEMLDISNPREVINIGDTPADLQAGKAAGCLRTLAVTNGTHSRAALEMVENDGLLDNISQLRPLILQIVSQQMATKI